MSQTYSIIVVMYSNTDFLIFLMLANSVDDGKLKKSSQYGLTMHFFADIKFIQKKFCCQDS